MSATLRSLGLALTVNRWKSICQHTSANTQLQACGAVRLDEDKQWLIRYEPFPVKLCKPYKRGKSATRFSRNNNFLLPTVHTNYGKETTCFAAVTFWNNLPMAIKSCPSLACFKKKSQRISFAVVNNFFCS